MMTEFHVKGYKSLADVKIPLTPIHVLIGQNDSGKTSVLEAMLALSRTTEKPLDEAFGGAWTGRELVYHGSPEPTIELGCKLQFASEPTHFEYMIRVGFPSPQIRYCRTIEERPKRDNVPVDLTWVGGEASNSVIYAMSAGLPTDSRRSIEEIKKLLAPAQYYRIDPKTMGLAANLEPARAFRMDSDGFGLSTMLDDINNDDREVMNAIKGEFCQLFPEFKKIKLTQSPGTNRTYQPDGSFELTKGNGKAIVFVTPDGHEVRAQQASDGALLFLAFLTLSHLPKQPKLLLIEEPEKGIYPKRLEELVRLLRQRSEEIESGQFPQIILTTHSPYLISSFTPEEVTLMRREEDGSSRARPLRDAPNLESFLGPFYLGELWYNLSEEELFGDVAKAIHD